VIKSLPCGIGHKYPMRANLTFLLLITALQTFSLDLHAQDLKIMKAKSPITIDGIMDEETWKEAEVADRFMQNFPYDSSEAKVQTEVRMTYDNDFIYVVALMYNLGPREYVIQSLRRDYRGDAYDGFTVVFDTYKDKTNAFLFGVNPYGVQREGLIMNGGISTSRRTQSSSLSSSFSLTWENIWYAEAKIYDDYWIAEMAIPFKTLRFKDNEQSWYANFYRIDSEHGERSTWAPIPHNFKPLNLAFNREVKWEEPINNPGRNISLIPYTALKSSKNFEDQMPSSNKFTLGGDAKVAISSALNLDITVNPDFSQVEADQQVTDLDRFELFFPEQRQFFLENSDLFGSFGSSSARPFFSRRIGIVSDTSTGTNIMNPLYFGGRISGNINNKWRIGAMTVQAAAEKEVSLPSVNYTVASVQRRIGERSNIAAMIVSKQPFQDSLKSEFTLSPSHQNRTIALDLNLATKDNRWSGKGYYHRSFDREALDNAYSTGIEVYYLTYHWEISSDFRSIGDNFNPEVGFVRRTDFNQHRGTAYFNFYPTNKAIQSHAPGFDYDVLSSGNLGITDWDLNLLYRINFTNYSRFSLRLRRQYTYLFEPYDPSGNNGIELDANTEYIYNFVIASFQSDQRNNFSYQIGTNSGEYYNGTRFSIDGRVQYRFIPRGYVSMNFDYNRIRLPDPYSDANLILVGPKLDITFSRKVFWTTYIQFNSQINNVNLNTRFQWRYKPASDLYIVYTDNYFSEFGNRFIDFSRPKSRAIILKLAYWFNI